MNKPTAAFLSIFVPLVVFPLVIPPLVVSGCSGAASPVGFVDMPRVYVESQTGKQASTDLNAAAQRDRTALGLDDLQQKIQKLVADKAAEADVTAARGKLDQAVQGFNAGLKQRDEISTARIVDSAKKIAERLAGDRKMSLVLYVKDRPLAAAAGVDLTDDVIKRLDDERASTASEVAALRSKVEQLEKQVHPGPAGKKP